MGMKCTIKNVFGTGLVLLRTHRMLNKCYEMTCAISNRGTWGGGGENVTETRNTVVFIWGLHSELNSGLKQDIRSMELLKVVFQIRVIFFPSFSIFSRLRPPPPPSPLVRYYTGHLEMK